MSAKTKFYVFYVLKTCTCFLLIKTLMKSTETYNFVKLTLKSDFLTKPKFLLLLFHNYRIINFDEIIALYLKNNIFMWKFSSCSIRGLSLIALSTEYIF